jgi:glycosyltransferase involved in cell wall biosynthesis
MEELHVVVFTTSRKSKVKSYKVGNLYVYPTNSINRWFYIFDAYRIGKQIVENWKSSARSPVWSGAGGEIENYGNVVISTQDPFETGLVGYFLRKKFRFPLQLQCHTDFFSREFKNSFLNKIRLKIARFLIPKSQGIRVVDELIKDSIISNFQNLKIIPGVLPVFVDIEKIINYEVISDIKKNFIQFDFVILMASRITKEKRINLAIECLKKVASQYPRVGLVIAGEGEEKANLLNTVKKLKLENNVIFIGWQNDLISLYKTADLFLLASAFEGYGMTLIEAGAAGCPIVTTKVGIAKTDLFKNGENSYVCDVDDVDCLYESILSIVKSKEKQELFKREIQASIKSKIISKDEYTLKYIDLLENLIDK